ncbi:hypothetical protein DDZ13_08200 [Coraliomargarita sinensis]|uniref:Uncharacterized protein n=1 Tax=Coraliomargarita sinensis TaxID=2174842 RepID=A0A317ZI95_9BACT|nr:hypothetical protein DDZ13_08200 [Coraliomargarita sinensis]
MSQRFVTLSESARISIVTVAGAMRDVPEEFVRDLDRWASEWPQKINTGQTSTIWGKVRPYTVAELSRLPGMPGQTKIYEILHSLPIPRHQIRNVAGKLTPEAVRLIFERVSQPEIKAQEGTEKEAVL